MTTCSVTDCPTRPVARGMCKKHYTRWRTTGDPLAVKRSGPKPKSAAERFWAQVNKDGQIPAYRPDLGPCWIWTGAPASEWGHGKFMDDGGRNTKAHRWAYEHLVGTIPDGLTLDHLCRVPACVNPSHLEPVTLAENLRRQGEAVTHCPDSHPVSGENLYLDPQTGYRHCRICRNRHSRNYRARKRSTGGRTAQLLPGGN